MDLLNKNWIKLLKINSNIPKSLKLYGLYLLKILDDKEKGEEMIRKSRNIQTSSNQNENESYFNQSIPTIVISGDHVINFFLIILF